MLVFNFGGEKWCKKYYSFASSPSRLLPLTCHLSPYEPHRNFLVISPIHHLYKIMYLFSKTFAHLLKKQYLCTVISEVIRYE